MRWFWAVVVPLSLASAQWRPNVAIDTRTIEELYTAAREEAKCSSKPLQVFLGGDAGWQGKGIGEAWKSQFPDLSLNLSVDLSKYHDTRIDTAFYEGENVADVAVLQTLQDFPRWKDENRLLFYKPAHFEDILQEVKDADGAWLPVFLNSFGTFFYDSTKCPSSTIPSSFDSIIDPMWKGKLVLTYPNDDDAVAYLFSLIISRYGASWFKALAANEVQWVRGTGTPIPEIVQQHSTFSERCLSFTQYGTFELNGTLYMRQKEPVAPEQIMSWAQTGAILSSTPRPEAAKLFMSWLTSPVFQASFSGKSQPLGSRTSVTGASVLDSVNLQHNVSPYKSNITQLTGFSRFEGDRAIVERWKNFFENTIGTPQGPSPLVIFPNPPCCY